jgi:hypothetical protein
MKKLLVLVCLTPFLLSTQASAQLIPLTGVTATSTSGNAEGNPGFTVSNNSLVAGPSTILGASDSLGDSGFNEGDASDFGNFVTSLSGGNVTYNLGAKYNVSDLLIWNFSQEGFNDAGINSVQILSSTTGTLGSFVVVGTFTFNEVTVDPGYGSPRPVAGNNPPYGLAGTANVPGQDLSVSIPDTQYVELLIQSNYGYGGGLVGINEINFVGTEAVPEPSTYAKMLAGLALLGFAVRRQRVVAKA